MHSSPNSICPPTSRNSVCIIHKLTHSSISTATIYIMQDGSTFNLHLRITLDQTGVNISNVDSNMYSIAFTTTIDVTEVSTTFVLCANRTASDIDIRIELNESTLTTTKDRAFDLGISINGHIGLAGQGQRLNKCNISSLISKNFPDTCSLICIEHHASGRS